jgi:hypothetical protein
MIDLILKVVFWGVFAVVIACVEIESEGAHGWADKAPTWYRVTGFWGRAYGLIMGGKPLTGYHLFMFFLPVLIFHAHFFMGVPWSPAGELTAWALYFVWGPLWDYYWFVLNPAYEGRFKQRHIWWHATSRWVLGLFPIDYAAGCIVSIGFAAGAAYVVGSWSLLLEHLKLLLGFGIFTVLLHLVAPAYRRWYVRMRRPGSDERHKVNRFYT